MTDSMPISANILRLMRMPTQKEADHRIKADNFLRAKIAHITMLKKDGEMVSFADMYPHDKDQMDL